MKTYRRLEITAFRRRVTVIAGDVSIAEDQSLEDVRISNTDTQTTIEPESAEGQRILLDAVRLLEEKLAKIQFDETD